ncbi:MAG TPA: hypothetical protein VFY68_05055 [Nitrososphaeraceae archaeon]|nr:hypothetical protein [Nitrososphaeraceae archaeon]
MKSSRVIPSPPIIILSIALTTSRRATLSEMIVSDCDFTAVQRKEIFKEIQVKMICLLE